MNSNEKALEMKEKIISELTRIKHQNPGSSFVIDDLIERIDKASKKKNSLTEFCSLLMNGTMALGMFGQVTKDDFTTIQNLNKECAELIQKK